MKSKVARHLIGYHAGETEANWPPYKLELDSFENSVTNCFKYAVLIAKTTSCDISKDRYSILSDKRVFVNSTEF